MSVVASSAAEAARPQPVVPRSPHVHAWELRAVEFDTWGQVSLYECEGCASVRYV